MGVAPRRAALRLRKLDGGGAVEAEGVRVAAMAAGVEEPVIEALS